MSVDAIVPAYNEERGVGNVVNSLLASELFDKIICVNDGSTDKTHEILSSYGDAVIVVTLESNMGKGYALAEGIKRSSANLILFSDADLVGLNKENLMLMLEPVISGDYQAVIARLTKPLLFNFFQKIVLSLSGQRVYYRKDLLALLDEMGDKRYGVEIFLNRKLSHLKTKEIAIHKVGHLFKQDKVSIGRALREYFVMTGELAREFLNL